jgi:hypothetical protein
MRDNITVIFNGHVSMDIYSPKGTKIRFIEQNPSSDYADKNNTKLLTLNEIYTVNYTEVHSCFTIVFLEEFPGVEFNSVWFEKVDG